MHVAELGYKACHEETKKETMKEPAGMPRVAQPRMMNNREFYDRFKPIRNTFRQFDPKSILQMSLEILSRREKNRIDQVQKHPWLHLLLLKWVFLDDEVNRSGRPAITLHQLQMLLQRTYELSWGSRGPNEFEGLTLFMRALAAQQFLYQHPLNLDGLARQHALFAGLEKGHFFEREFLRAKGLPIEVFVKLALGLLTKFLETPGYTIHRSYFAPLEQDISPEHIDAFLAAVSVNIEDLPVALGDLAQRERRMTEFVEETPFIGFPLIRVAGAYWCVYPEILHRSIGHFVFDALKKADLVRFNLHFGRRFEKYVGEYISATGLPFATEEELDQKLPGQGNLVDFLVVDGNANIFIDAKGVEMAPRGRIAHLRDVVRGATENSLLKAVEQGQAVNARLLLLERDDPVVQWRAESFLIAVTYKELYIGNGLMLSSAVGEEALNRILSAYPQAQRIPLERIYFLTIDELERLMQMVKEGRISLHAALKRAETTDADPQKRKFMFSMHLQDWPESQGLSSPLADSFAPVIDDLQDILETRENA